MGEADSPSASRGCTLVNTVGCWKVSAPAGQERSEGPSPESSGLHRQTWTLGTGADGRERHLASQALCDPPSPSPLLQAPML